MCREAPLHHPGDKRLRAQAGDGVDPRGAVAAAPKALRIVRTKGVTSAAPVRVQRVAPRRVASPCDAAPGAELVTRL